MSTLCITPKRGMSTLCITPDRWKCVFMHHHHLGECPHFSSLTVYQGQSPHTQYHSYHRQSVHIRTVLYNPHHSCQGKGPNSGSFLSRSVPTQRHSERDSEHTLHLSQLWLGVYINMYNFLSLGLYEKSTTRRTQLFLYSEYFYKHHLLNVLLLQFYRRHTVTYLGGRLLVKPCEANNDPLSGLKLFFTSFPYICLIL